MDWKFQTLEDGRLYSLLSVFGIYRRNAKYNWIMSKVEWVEKQGWKKDEKQNGKCHSLYCWLPITVQRWK